MSMFIMLFVFSEMKCPPPPPLPPNYVHRPELLNELVIKLCQSAIDPDSYGTSLTVTGAGGFGKTSIVTALCHHPVIKEQFKDGVVFIELGPQATDPSMKLSQLYHLLTGEYLKQGDVNYAEQEIKQLSNVCRNLLVIIDDVWHVEDAEPIVKAFSSCKIVLTTRMNDIEQYIPTKQVVSVGPMEQSEAISLLTNGVIDISQLSQEDVNLLDELAQDVHLWPLLLSLVRGQLFHNLKKHNLHPCGAIKNVQAKLHEKGLTAFDKSNAERYRKYAVGICINNTLELLTKSISDKLKSLILRNGIGASLQMSVLHCLWNVTKLAAMDIVDILYSYGLIQFTDMTIPPKNNKQRSVEVHAIVSQYMIESMDSREVYNVSLVLGLKTYGAVKNEIEKQFRVSFGIHNVTLLPAKDFLKYKVVESEYLCIPFYLKQVNMRITTDPHLAIVILRYVKSLLMKSHEVTYFLPSVHLQIDHLICDCQKVLKDTHKLSKKFNHCVRQYLAKKNYHGLFHAIEVYVSDYPIGFVAQQAVLLIKKCLPYCHGKLQNAIMLRCEELQSLTNEYHSIKILTLPLIKLSVKELEEINRSLQAGVKDIEQTYDYFKFGKYLQEQELINRLFHIKLQEVAPNWVQNQNRAA